MASGPNTFSCHVVFTAEKFQGNPLAVVSVHGNSIPHQRKALIAKDFGYPETVFLHDAPGPGLPRKIEIFTGDGEELPFAGHPIIGVTHFIFSALERKQYKGATDRNSPPQRAVLETKAGIVPVFFNHYRQLAACTIPHNFHIHSKRVSVAEVLEVQPHIQIIPTYDKIKDKTFPVVSLVKGMTFVLIDLTEAPEVLAGLKKREAPLAQLDEGWSPSFVGAFYYVKSAPTARSKEQPIHNIRARMICQDTEDPGTGSASCTLATYLSLTSSASEESDISTLEQKVSGLKLDNKLEHHVYAIEQGIEMGRRCQIAVEVDLKRGEDGKRSVSTIILSGRCNSFMEGRLLGE